MDHLADSIAKLNQGRKNWYIGREGIPVEKNVNLYVCFYSGRIELWLLWQLLFSIDLY